MNRRRLASRMGAVGVLVLLASLPVFAMVLPLLDYRQALRDRVADLEWQGVRLKALAAARDDLRRQDADLAVRRAKSGLMLTGGSEALATATLQNLIKTAVARAGGELRSTQAMPVTGDHGARRLTVRALLSADVEGLRTFLHAVESGRPMLFVNDLDIRARANARAGDEAEKAVLEIRVDVTGYLGE